MSKNVKTSHGLGLSAKNKIGNIIAHVVIVTMCFIWVLPFVGILLESFRMETTMQVGYLIPKDFGIGNYIALFEKTNFAKWYTNTLIVGIFVSIIQTFTVLCVSYTLSRMRFKGRRFLMNMMLVLGMFPGFITVIVLYNILSDLNMTGVNAVPGLILLYTASSGMGYYVAKGFFDTISKSLDEAARIDGASRAQVMFTIILPLAKPIVIYTILTAFMAPWGDFMTAAYIAHNTSEGMNVAVGIQNMIGSQMSLNAHYTHFCAAGVLVAIPITILFFALQKYYVEGVTGGAVKG
ncbi:MAG: ABC transporter permease subunit [Lachnospiraceae bacterium]|nr:ABC transporter permease subunit [Lachnospiraceae bacterium]